MPSITFTCRTITPLFTQRARPFSPEDFQRNPEFYFNAQLFKGPLRFWWRAMMPYADNDEKVSNLWDQEAEIFGGIVKGNPKRSSFRIKTKVLSYECSEKGWLAGCNRYLLFSALENNRPFITDVEFSVEFRTSSTNILNSISYSFWLLANFGGIGSRSRRGGGNFQITEYSAEDYSFPQEFNPVPHDTTDWFREPKVSDYLKTTLNFILRDSNSPPIHSEGEEKKPNILHTNYCNLRHAQLYFLRLKSQNGQHALGRLSMPFQTMRFEGDKSKMRKKVGEESVLGKNLRDKSIPERSDYLSVRGFVEKHQLPKKPIQKTTFGLPLNYSFDSIKNPPKKNMGKDNGATIYGVHSKDQGEILERSATSFFLGITAVRDTYWPVIVDFYTKLIPDEYNLAIKGFYGDQGRDTKPLDLPGRVKRELFLEHPSFKIISQKNGKTYPNLIPLL